MLGLNDRDFRDEIAIAKLRGDANGNVALALALRCQPFYCRAQSG